MVLAWRTFTCRETCTCFCTQFNTICETFYMCFCWSFSMLK
uniref:Uncharacterized protein n=1 Tax=Rhizophora mucronata TaxID=61149 RepID=A0A2P2PR17_RHIMU